MAKFGQSVKSAVKKQSQIISYCVMRIEYCEKDESGVAFGYAETGKANLM